ncbi:MAG: Fic family protein [Rhodothermales bacterium]|nr:Fic family protein [Rhodothermales bacterium]MBO6780245.1 Fic family protein [Rhodothermales bacterium]
MQAPAAIPVSADILRLIGRIDEFKGAWKALGDMALERLDALKRVATIESIGSSTRIEGARLSDSEVERLLANLEVGSFETRDEQEVAGYAEVMDTIFGSWQDLPVSENYILQLHGILLRHSEKDAWHHGRYKSSPNHVVTRDASGQEVGVVFETASPVETPVRMAELVDWYNGTRTENHALLRIATFVVVFLAIHPFQDGNGRLSRALTTLLLLKAGYAYVPFSSLESVIEGSKQQYYVALRRTQSTLRSEEPDFMPWLRYFLQSLDEQAVRLARKLEAQSGPPLPELSAAIIAMARRTGRVTMSDAVRATGASRNTLKGHFRSLVEQGLLRLHGAGRGAWYERG